MANALIIFYQRQENMSALLGFGAEEHENKKEEEDLKEHNTKKVKGGSQDFSTESSKTSLSD